MSLENDLREVGTKYLTVDGQAALEIYIKDGESRMAQVLLLGAIDRNWIKGRITDDVARVLYQKIGLPPEDSARLRNSNKYWNGTNLDGKL